MMYAINQNVVMTSVVAPFLPLFEGNKTPAHNSHFINMFIAWIGDSDRSFLIILIFPLNKKDGTETGVIKIRRSTLLNLPLKSKFPDRTYELPLAALAETALNTM
jgi:hypothetical protein